MTSHPSRREQMPGLLTRVDDPWGIGWRLANAVRRFSLRRNLRWLAGWLRGVRYERPILIFGVPRSGTTLLFHLLRSAPGAGSLPGEGHDIWRLLHHPRYHGWRSDALGPGMVRRGERRLVSARFHADVGDRRLVEKTPESSLRLPYLLELFPDAFLVAVHRHPLEVINSLIHGWRHPAGRFRSYYVPENLEIPGYAARRRWCFALVEGWRALRDHPIPEIAFEQWRQCAEGVIAGRALVPAERWLELRLEDFLDHPGAMAAGLCQALGLGGEEQLAERARELAARPVNALSPPGEEKWRRDHPAEIEPLLPRIAPIARRLGYAVDPVSGTTQRLS